MENQFVQTQFTNPNRNNNHKPIPQPINRVQYQDKQQGNFYPQLAHMPQPSLNFQQFRPTLPMRYYNNQYNTPHSQKYPNPNFGPPRPNAPKPQPRPELMDVDSSMRSKAVNYINRPAQNSQFFGKRPTDQPEHFRNLQRNFHLQTERDVNFNENQYKELENYEKEEELSTLDDYLQNQTETLETETQEFVDIHFLDQQIRPYLILSAGRIQDKF